MKKLSKLVLAVAGALSLMFASGCSNISDDATIEGGSVNGYTANVDGAKTDISFGSRTIIPAAYDGENDLSYFLTYKKQTETDYALYTVDATTGEVKLTTTTTTDATTGETKTKTSFLISLPNNAYDFILYAVKKADVANVSLTNLSSAAVLASKTQADLSRGDAISFTLKSDNTLLKGNGSVYLYLYSDGWDTSSYTVSAQIEDLLDSTKGPYSAQTITTLPTTALSGSDIDYTQDANHNFTSAATLTAGTYNFVVKFTNSSDTTKVFEYSDHIIINANTNTTGQIPIPKVVIDPPADSTYLRATYIEPASENVDSYKVQFEWDDNANNESYFELQLAELPSTVVKDAAEPALELTLPTQDTQWSNYETVTGFNVTRYGVENTAISNTYTPNDTTASYSDITTFYGTSNDNWVSGSLNKNNEVIIMSLPLGKRYEARISAVNAAGRSKWTYATLGTAVGTATNTKNGKGTVEVSKAFTSVVAANATSVTDTSKSINLYRMTYEIGDGTFYTDSTAKTEATTPGASSTVYKVSNNKIVNYYNQSETSGIAILNPNGDDQVDGDTDGTADTLFLSNSSQEWSNWKSSTDSAGKTTTYADYNEVGTAPVAYTGYSSITLTAKYSTRASVTIFDANAEELSTVEVTAGSGTVALTNNKTLTADKTANGTLTWTVTYPDGVTYNNVVIKLWPTNDSSKVTTLGTISASAGTVTQNLSDIDVGTYTVSIIATTDNNTLGYTYNITLTVTDKGSDS